MPQGGFQGSLLKRFNLSVFFASVGFAFIYLIPAFAEQLGATYLELGVIGTARSIPYMFLPVVAGYLGDKFNRYRLFLSSMLVAGLAMLLLAATNTIETIVLVQVVLGMGFSLFWPLSEALVSEAAPLETRTQALGIYAVAWASGFLVGPLLGGFVASVIGFQMAFLLAGAVVVATGAISLATIRWPAKKQAHKAEGSTRTEWTLVWKFLPVLIAQVPYGIVFAFIVSIFPGYAIQAGLTAFEVGILASGFGFARILMFSASGSFERLGETKSMALAFVGTACVLLVIPVNSSLLALLVDLCAIGAFIGIIYPQTVGYIGKGAPSANLGFAMGLYETVFGIGFAAGPITSGFLAQVTSPEVAYVALSVTAVSVVPILLLAKPTGNP